MDDAYIAALNRARPTMVVAGPLSTMSALIRRRGQSDSRYRELYETALERGGTRLPAAPNLRLEQIVYLESLSSQALPSGGGYREPAYGV